MVTKKLKGLGLGLEALLGPRVPEAGDAAASERDAMPHALKLDQLQPASVLTEPHLVGMETCSRCHAKYKFANRTSVTGWTRPGCHRKRDERN